MINTLFAAAALVLLPPTSTPDIIPEGVRIVRVDRIAEIDPLRDVCCLQYIVQEGDTLADIAKEQLGITLVYVALLNDLLQPIWRIRLIA